MIVASRCASYSEGFRRNFTPIRNDPHSWAECRDDQPGPLPDVTLALFESGFQQDGMFNGHGEWSRQLKGKRTGRNNIRKSLLARVGKNGLFRAFITLDDPDVPDADRVLHSWFIEDFVLRLDSVAPSGEFRAKVEKQDPSELWEFLETKVRIHKTRR